MSAGMLAAAQVISQLIGLVVLVAVSRRIGPLYLGAYAFAYNIVAYVGLVTTLGLPTLGMRDLGHSSAPRRRILSETATARVMLVVFFGTTLVIATPLITSSAASQALLPILAIKLLTDALTFDWYLQGTQRHAVVAVSRVIGQVAYAAVMLPLLAAGLTGARHYAIANIIGLAVIAVIMIVLVRHELRPILERVAIRSLRKRISRSMPFLSWIALTQIYYSTDLILVAYLAGDRKAGLYAAASKLPISVIGVASLWFTVSMPEIARLYSKTETTAIQTQARVAATAAIVAGTPFVFLGPVFARDIMLTLFGPKFVGSGPALAILSASVAVTFLQIVVTSLVMGAGRERAYVRAMSVGAAANLLLNLILIPRLGIIGAAISTIVAESMVLAAGILQILPVTGVIKPRWRAVAESILIAICAIGVGLDLRHAAGFIAGALGVAAVYAAAILFRTARDPRWLGTWLGGVSA